MANAFQQELATPSGGAQIFAQPASDPVDNSVANAINAVSGLAKMGFNEYKNFQQDKTIRGVTQSIALNQQAVSQGKMRIGDADLKDNAALSAAIVANPHLAIELRQAAIAVKGTDVTAELDQAARHDAEQAEAAQDSATSMFIQTSAQSGFAPTKADGSFDQEKMVDYGIKEQKRRQAIELLKSQNSSSTQAEREDVRRTKYERDVYASFSESKLDVLRDTVGRFNTEITRGTITPERENALVEASVQGIESSVRDLRAEVLAAGNTSSDADFFEAKFRASADAWTGQLTGEKSLAKRTSDNASWIKSNMFIDVADKLPVVTALSNSGINLDKLDIEDLREQEGQLPETGFSLGTTYNGADYVPLSGLLSNSAKVISYGKDWKNLDSVQEQTEVYRVANKTLNDGLNNFEDTTPDERIGLTNSLNVHVQAGSDVNNSVDSAVKFADYYNRPSLRNSLSKLSKDGSTSNKVEKLSDARLDYVSEMIKRAVGNLNYNPDTGRTGNAYTDALLGNIDTFYPYSSPKDTPIDTFKNELMGVEVTSSAE